MCDNHSIVNCLHPRRVRNKVTKEMVTVPCGACEACKSRHASNLVSRMEMETLSWKYCVFFTLTYDNDNLPLLSVQDSFLTDLSAKRVHPIKGVTTVDTFEVFKGMTSQQIARQHDFISLLDKYFGGVPYLSTVDAQRFMKRLRILISREFKKQISHPNEKETPICRYCICGEYGPTTYRPHMHGILWFSSDWLAVYVHEYIRKCWKYGNTDSSFVTNSASNYVASYIDSFAHLPAIYKARSIRPFLLYSKHPALGTLVYSSESVKNMFLSGNIMQCFLETSAQLPLSVPMWRTFQDTLYPRLPYFSVLNSRHRVTLYRILESTDFWTKTNGSLNAFLSAIERCNSEYVKKYLELQKQYGGKYIDFIYKWFNICKRVSLQSRIFGITTRDYVDRIEKFYASKDYSVLKSQYEFEEKYSKEKQNALGLVGIDTSFLASLRYVPFDELDVTELLYLQSFDGLDFDALFSTDSFVRSSAWDQLELEKQDFYMAFKEDTLVKYKRNQKTKKKNDYILSQSDNEFYQQISVF